MIAMSVNIMMAVAHVITNAKILKDLFSVAVILVTSSVKTTPVAMISKNVLSKMVVALIHVSKSKVLIIVNVQKVMSWGAMMPPVLMLMNATTVVMDARMLVRIMMVDISVLAREAKSLTLIKRHALISTSVKKTFTIVTMKFPIVLMKSIQKLSAVNVTKDITFWVVPVTTLMNVIKMIRVVLSKRVQTHQEVTTVHVENKDINSMIELVNVKILTNVDLVPITVPLISDAKILMAVFYANLKRLPLRQLPVQQPRLQQRQQQVQLPQQQ